jgi:hypothetical protein
MLCDKELSTNANPTQMSPSELAKQLYDVAYSAFGNRTRQVKECCH